MTSDTAPISPDAAGSRLTVDLTALADNWRTLAAAAPDAACAAVVKGNAYGIGLDRTVKALAGAGCKTFFVALPHEGIALRALLPDAEIYILDGLVGGVGAYVGHRLKPVLNSLDEIEAWAGQIEAGTGPGAALQIDSGMNRLGLTPDEAAAVAAEPTVVEKLGVDLVMSHLACADTPDNPKNAAQLVTFRAARQLFPEVRASLANSAGILLGADYHFDLVRPGIALYGGKASRDRPALKPVVTFQALILQVREAPAGQTVGYGATQTLAHWSRIAIVAAGYADGYHRRAGSRDGRIGARAFVHGKPAPLVGRVSMDLIAIDVTVIEAAKRGDWVELFGPNIPLDEVAERAGTIGYELLTGIGRRCDPIYVGGQ